MDELVFTVEGAHAHPAKAVTLGEIGLTERQHLQEWVLAHPQILGSDVLVVTFEFDRWWTAGSTPLDRLDVLGLDASGRLVVAELKRDAAPDTVEMQAIKYAAMVSRFTPETLTASHVAFLKARGEVVTETEATERLLAHLDVEGLSPDVLRQPRIVLLAASFPPVVTATAVWLREMGVDMTLIKFQAYRTATETLVTVSQLLPVPSVEDFTVIPRMRALPASSSFPSVDWTPDDLQRFAALVTNPSVQAMMDLCAARPGGYVTFGEVVEHTGRGQFVVRSDLAVLSQLIKKRISRSNWPLEVTARAPDGLVQYQLSAERAEIWQALRAAPPNGVVQPAPPEADQRGVDD